MKPETRNAELETRNPVAFVLCGALAREVRAIVERQGWNVALFGVSALDHLRPERIAPDVERRLRELIPRYQRIVVVYGDCGSQGWLDEALTRYNVPRIAGPHCYEMYAGEGFEQLIAEQPGTFVLTDFLVRSFGGSVIKGLGLDRYPELKPLYFGNYTRLVYLVQGADALIEPAQAIADWLGLPLEVRHTGYGLLEQRLIALMSEIHAERYRPIMATQAAEVTDEHVSNHVLERYPDPGARARRRRPSERGAA